MSSYILPFSQIDSSNQLISKPIRMLAEVYNKGADVADGFCIDYRSFRDFENKNQLHKVVKHFVHNNNKKNNLQLEKNLLGLKKAFREKPLPIELSNQLDSILSQLFEKGHIVALRVAFPNLPKNFITFPPLNPNSRSKTENLIKEIWAEINFKINLNKKHSLKDFCILFQILEPTEITINAYTTHPLENTDDSRFIEAWLGWQSNDKKQMPETYFVNKESYLISRLSINHQEKQIVLEDNQFREKRVANHIKESPKLTERLVRQICSQLKSLEDHYQIPLKINFGYVRGKLFIHSILPLTLVKKNNLHEIESSQNINNQNLKTLPPLVIGKTAYPGKISGRVFFIKKPSDYLKINKSHICVVNSVDMRYVGFLQNAGGIISEQAGQNNPAAILSREWKLPCLIGVEKTKTKLTNNQIITLDTRSGFAFSGSGVYTIFNPHFNKANFEISKNIGVEVDDAFILPSLASKNFNGDVFISTDKILKTYVGVHPNHIKISEFKNLYLTEIENILDSFHSNTAIIMTNKLNMSAFRKLRHGSKYEAKIKNNSNLLYGPSRYIESPLLFKRELSLISKLAKERYSQDIKVCVPSIRTKAEFEFVYQLIEKYDLLDRFLISIDINSTVFILDDLFQMASFDIIIDLPSLAKQLVVRDRLDSDLIHQSDPAGLGIVLEIMKYSAQRRGVSVFLRTGSLSFGPEQKKVLHDLNLDQIILDPQGL